jgi:hypothetical protein
VCTNQAQDAGDSGPGGKQAAKDWGDCRSTRECHLQLLPADECAMSTSSDSQHVLGMHSRHQLPYVLLQGGRSQHFVPKSGLRLIKVVLNLCGKKMPMTTALLGISKVVGEQL